MATNHYRLYGAPTIFPGESISSWLQRFSQQQGISIEKLFLLAGAKIPKDYDFVGISAGLAMLINMCGLPSQSFGIAYAVVRAIQRTKPLQPQVRADKEGRPVSGVCPVCLDSDRIPYYRIEWRFKFWKYCPIHELPMVTVCGKCKRDILLDREILLSINPPPSLAYCRCCLSKFVHANESQIDDTLSLVEKISVQRNLMAGIINGYCMIAPHQKKFSLHVMARFHELGLLLPATRDDFNNINDPKEAMDLEKFLIKIQVKIRRKELIHERASRRRRARSTSRAPSIDQIASWRY